MPALIDTPAPLQLYPNRGALHYHLPWGPTNDDDDDVWHVAPMGVPAPTAKEPYIFWTRWPAPSLMANANARYYPNTSVRLLQGTTFIDSFELQGKPLGPPEEPEDCVR